MLREVVFEPRWEEDTSCAVCPLQRQCLMMSSKMKARAVSLETETTC